MAPIILALLMAGTEPAQPPPLPEDWSALAEPEFRRDPYYTARMGEYVTRTYTRGPCTPPPQNDEGWTIIRVDVAVLVAENGELLDVVPADVGCPLVENHTKNLIEDMFRRIMKPPETAIPTWYRTHMTFSWHD